MVSPVADDGYESPDFDLPPLDESDEEPRPPPSKRARHSKPQPRSLEDDEALAAALLRR